MPDTLGAWQYNATFSDGAPGISGSFTCVASNIPGMISKDETNPRWFGYKSGGHVGGQPLFATNFSAVNRDAFLDWVQQQGYNMLSVGSFFPASRPTPGTSPCYLTPADVNDQRKHVWVMMMSAVERVNARNPLGDQRSAGVTSTGQTITINGAAEAAWNPAPAVSINNI